MTFLHEGNETMIDGLVNFEKMVCHSHPPIVHVSSCLLHSQRLMAAKVRTLFAFRTGSLPNEIRLLANKNPDLQNYIRYGQC